MLKLKIMIWNNIPRPVFAHLLLCSTAVIWCSVWLDVCIVNDTFSFSECVCVFVCVVVNSVPRHECVLNPEAKGCIWTCLPPPLFSFFPYRCPPHPFHSPPPSVPQCVWLVAQTLCIRIALQQCSSEEGKKQHISAISVKRSSFLSTHKETAPQNVLTQQHTGPL